MKQEVLESIIRQIPVARMGQPEEIAATVAFLASKEAAFITGATITANGGQYMV
jgi:acetoacetyl-CoA reductase